MTRHTLLAVLCLSTLAACGDKEAEAPEDDDWGLEGGGGTGGGDDTGAACGSTHGFVSGLVTGPYSDDPNPDARVYAYAEDSGDSTPAEMAGDGTYELNVEGGHRYSLYAYEGACYSSDVRIVVEECEEYEVDIEIIDCDVADKPNLYLYPEGDTPMAVRLQHSNRQRIVASDPPYRPGGWRGLAHPDGTFTVDGRRAPFLFYEVSLAPWQSASMQRAQGWCLPEAGAVEAMAELLGRYGFDARERNDFVEAWEHDLPPSPGGYAVYPQLSVDHIADIDIQPPLAVDRLWLTLEDGTGCAIPQEPVVVPFDRSGPHGVEWGVVLHRLGR